MTSLFRCLGTAAVLISGAASSYATTLDFTSLPQGLNGGTLTLPEATIHSLVGGRTYVGSGAAGESDGFCFVPSASISCENDGEILFTSPVSALSLDVDGWGFGDFVAITAFNGATALGTLNATGNMHLDFSGFGTITRLLFDDSSTNAGVGFSTITFDAGTAVPEPASVVLTGLALLGVWASRRATR